MDNLYQPPKSELKPQTSQLGKYGSLENGINGEYELSIGNILNEAWEKTNGIKGSLWAAFLISFIIMVPLVALSHTAGENLILTIIFQIVQSAISNPLFGGIFMIGLLRSIEQPFSYKEVFRYFPKLFPLLLASIFSTIIIIIGFILLIIPGIYFGISYMLTIPLIVEKNLEPWQAMEASRKAITHSWFKVFGLYILLALIVLSGVTLTLGIGLIWLLPFSSLVNSILYREIFGIGVTEVGGESLDQIEEDQTQTAENDPNKVKEGTDNQSANE